jgi:hypothetical protein
MIRIQLFLKNLFRSPAQRQVDYLHSRIVVLQQSISKLKRENRVLADRLSEHRKLAKR